MATIRYRWGIHGYIAIGVATVAIAALVGFRGETFTGEVVRVVDGDTLCLQGPAGEVVLRVWGVDCPEMDQPFGWDAKAFTAGLALGQVVKVTVEDVDRYRRRVAVVTLSDGRDLGNELIRAGCAWWTSDYAPRDVVKKGLEIEARFARKGLWATPQPVAPWEWRHRR